MQIVAGLADHQVLQRNRNNVSETLVSGSCNTSGILQISVTRNGKSIPGFKNKVLGRINAGTFQIKLAGIPIGGPYELTLTLDSGERFVAHDILVGDVWILAGQSNMEGIGLLKKAAAPHPMVRAFYMNDRWAVAKDPIHNLASAVDPVHTDLNGGTPCVRNKAVGVGPGVAFGQTMFNLSGVPQGLIACAHGGTTMTDWNPEQKQLDGKSLYGATLRRFHKNGSRVAGIVWYQGCSDANENDAPLYTDRMKTLVAAFRKDLGNPQLPFGLVQIACYHSTITGQEKYWNSIQDQQRLLPKIIKNLITVPAIDLELDDCIHISGSDQQRLGRRLAQALWTLQKGKKAQKPPMEIKAIKKHFTKNLSTLDIEITFKNVEGKLQASGRPYGFTLCDRKGRVLDLIYRIDLKDNKAILRTANCWIADLYVHYGLGCSPYCNITDSADRSLPVFGPIAVSDSHAVPICDWRISKILPGAGKLQNVTCPDHTDPNMAFTSRQFIDSFANLHEELQHKTDDALVFFASRFRCATPMPLQIGLGYDGPVKMWIDRKEVFYDPNGTNPVIPEQARIHFDASAGEHELIVAFSANFGRAWGIVASLSRKDITRRTLRKENNACILPEIIG